MLDALHRAIRFGGTSSLLHEDFVRRALVAAVLLGVLAGLMAPLVVVRNMAFAVHGTSELTTTGGAAALLGGWSVGTGALAGSILAALLFGLLGRKSEERDSVIGVILAFGLGLGVLFLSLYQGRTANRFGLLVGQVVSVDTQGLATLIVCLLIVCGVLLVVHRPLLFASCDPHMAEARGVPTRLLTPLFAVLLGLSVAFAVQSVGAILVLSVMITPGAAASRITARPWLVTLLAVAFAEVALVGGVILSLGPGLPTSPYVTTISFVTYLACRSIARLRRGPRALPAAA